jgi:hypothetical protein
MGDAQEQAQRLAGELEQRGARNVDVQGDLAVDAFDSTTSENSGTGSRLFGHDAEITAVYDGDPEWVRNAVSALPRLEVQHVQDEQWPGGDTRVTADIVLLDAGSGGGNPGGNTDASPPTEGVPPPSDRVDDDGPEWTYYGHALGRTEDSG